MKINHLKRYLIGIAMIAFLAILAGNAFANSALNDNASRDSGTLTLNKTASNYANNYMVMSPYWQAESGGSYTFVAVSHSSLSGMASQIGVVFNAITSDKTAYDTAQRFTVTAGETKRVFIINTNHSSINSTNQPNAAFVAGTTNFTYGHLRIMPAATHPMLRVHDGKAIKVTNQGDGFRDATMLTYWGSVIVEANTTGFAMEFIGDLNDSRTMAFGHMSTFSSTNQMGSGPNIQ